MEREENRGKEGEQGKEEKEKGVEWKDT